MVGFVLLVLIIIFSLCFIRMRMIAGTLVKEVNSLAAAIWVVEENRHLMDLDNRKITIYKQAGVNSEKIIEGWQVENRVFILDKSRDAGGFVGIAINANNAIARNFACNYIDEFPLLSEEIMTTIYGTEMWRSRVLSSVDVNSISNLPSYVKHGSGLYQAMIRSLK